MSESTAKCVRPLCLSMSQDIVMELSELYVPSFQAPAVSAESVAVPWGFVEPPCHGERYIMALVSKS